MVVKDWQKTWNNSTGNKLQSVKPTIDETKQQKPVSCREAVVLNRLRIGHTRLTHSYLLSHDDQPECMTCQCPLTVEHILIECTDFNNVRAKHFVANSMKELFESVDSSNIIDFTKEIQFYSQL